jgi:hypothetical protein
MTLDMLIFSTVIGSNLANELVDDQMVDDLVSTMLDVQGL